jgi:lysophospholipase L1-like esterase
MRTRVFALLTGSYLLCTAPVFAADTLNLGPIWSRLQQKAATGSADIVVFGDSLSIREDTYTYPLRSALQNLLGNAGLGYVPVSGAGNAGFYSGAWTGGLLNGDNAPHNGLSGFWTVGESGYGFLDLRAKQASLVYASTPASGSIYFYYQTAQGQEVPITTLNTASTDGTSSVKTYTFNLPSADTRMYMHPMENGPVTLLGVMDTPVSNGVRLSIAANGGWTTQQFLNRNSTFEGILTTISADTAFIMLGQNDQNFYTPAQFEANMRAFVNRLKAGKPDMDICLISSYDSGTTRLAEYAAIEEKIAAEQGIGFINLFSLGGPYSTFTTNGYLDDGTHFNAAGGQYVSNVLFNTLTAAVPEPASLAILAIGSGMLLARRKRG